VVDYESLSSGYRETCMHWNRRSSITPLFFLMRCELGITRTAFLFYFRCFIFASYTFGEGDLETWLGLIPSFAFFIFFSGRAQTGSLFMFLFLLEWGCDSY
jgi:hypothetical protein